MNLSQSVYWQVGGSELCLTYATNYVRVEVCLSGGSNPLSESVVNQQGTMINQPENEDGDQLMAIRNRSTLRKIKKGFAILFLGVSVAGTHLFPNMHSKKAAFQRPHTMWGMV